MRTRVEQKSVAKATALGAGVPQAKLFTLSQETAFSDHALQWIERGQQDEKKSKKEKIFTEKNIEKNFHK